MWILYIKSHFFKQTNKKPYYFLDITHVWALKVFPALLMLHANLVW